MVAPEGSGYAPWTSLKAAEALVRSLVGVAGVTVRADAHGALREIVITPEHGASDRRVGRDVRSALKARFGMSLDPETITIIAPEAETEKQHPLALDWPYSSVPAGDRDGKDVPGALTRDDAVPGAGESAASPPDPEQVASPKPGTLETAEPSTVAEPGAEARSGPGPWLEAVDMETLEQGMRCRVTVTVDGECFHGVAEAATGFYAEAELAARVTVDAMRAARTPRQPLQLKGVTLIDLAGRPHVVVSLALWTGNRFEPLAGAEPVGDSIARAAACAVVGSVIAYSPGPAPSGAATRIP